MSPSLAAAEVLVQRLAGPVPATMVSSFGDLHVDVPEDRWLEALRIAHDELALTFLDWLSAYDDTPRGFAVVVHLVSQESGARLLIRTSVPADDATVPTATDIWPGAAWHERETAEMFGISFAGHPTPGSLLLHPDFEGQPLRKDFVLASRAVKDWPGAKDPAEVPGRTRRRPALPPGVPLDWGSS